jgi:hypothetical protein
MTVVFGIVVAWLLMDLPRTESELPWPDLTRDVVYEREAVDAALGRVDSPPDDHARTPGAIVVLLPLALIPADFLTSTASIVSVISLGLIAAGTVRLRPTGYLGATAFALSLSASVSFIQAVFHGSTFVPLAACLVWMWVYLQEGRPIQAGALLAVAGVSRLWPFLVIVVLMRRRQVRALSATVAGAGLLTIAGVLLPGITVGGSLDAVIEGGAGWITAEHNGSLASWLIGFGAVPAAVVGLIAALSVWYLGLRRSPNLDSDVGWTLPAAILASPLAWLPYLLTVAPFVMPPSRSRISTLLVLAVAFVQVVGYRLVSQQVAMTASVILIGALVWSQHLAPGQPDRTGGTSADAGVGVVEDDRARSIGHLTGSS